MSAVKAVDVTANSNHADVGYLRGWSLRGTFVARLRAGSVSGQILASVENSQSEVFDSAILATGGTYVEVVTGTITEGVLLYT